MTDKTPRTDAAHAKFIRRTYTGECRCVDFDDMALLEKELSATTAKLREAEKMASVWHQCVMTAATIMQIDVLDTPRTFLTQLCDRIDRTESAEARTQERIAQLHLEWNRRESAALQRAEAAEARLREREIFGDNLSRACNLAGVDYQTYLRIKAYLPVDTAASPLRHLIDNAGIPEDLKRQLREAAKLD